MESQQLVDRVKADVKALLEEKQKNDEISSDAATAITNYITSALDPSLTERDLYEVIENFDEHFPELLPIVVKYSDEYEKELHQFIGTDVEELLNEGKIEEATTEMKNFELGEGKKTKNSNKEENAS